ncbi:tectonin domain-containing protein [Sorangium sp. So ce764]|uniref:tectonin domain-containing protein n=1 Tax=Sorangium sp. So ce764 TaxID=3133320 RepID=UPI003F5D68CA
MNAKSFVRSALAGACLMSSAVATAQDLQFYGTGGTGLDIGHGGGKVWAVGITGKVYRFDTPPGAWTEIGGITTGLRIDVDSGGNPWVVTRDQKLFTWNGGWYQVYGDIRDVGRSAVGDHMWAIGGGGDGRGNFNIYRWEGQAGWVQKPGVAARIDVDPDGVPWVVNAYNAIYRWNGADWNQIPGGATDIGIGAERSVWVVGNDGTLFWWNSRDWDRRGGRLAQVSVDEGGNPWGVDPAGSLLRGKRTDVRLVHAYDGAELYAEDYFQNGSRWRAVFVDYGRGRPAARWIFGGDGSLRNAAANKCIHLKGEGVSGWTWLLDCNGAPESLGWFWSASDRTIRKSSHPAGCVYRNASSSFEFALTCEREMRYAITIDVR